MILKIKLDKEATIKDIEEMLKEMGNKWMIEEVSLDYRI